MGHYLALDRAAIRIIKQHFDPCDRLPAASVDRGHYSAPSLPAPIGIALDFDWGFLPIHLLIEYPQTSGQ